MAGEKASEEHTKRPTALDEFISIDIYIYIPGMLYIICGESAMSARTLEVSS